jgi:hypothetical protein
LLLKIVIAADAEFETTTAAAAAVNTNRKLDI